MSITLSPQPLTREGFAPFGDVIDTTGSRCGPMNDGRFERYEELCAIDVDESGRVAVGIARCRKATSLPYRLQTVERHPLGSQAFIPLQESRFVVVVGPPGPAITASDLCAFETNGRQGVNYRRGAWHMPLIANEVGQSFLVIDYAGDEPNCELHHFDEPVMLVGGQ